MPKRRVVISGMGVISPIGNNIEEFTQSLKIGKSGIEEIKSFKPEGLRHKYGGEIKKYDPLEHFSLNELKRMDRASQIALLAAKEALEMSELDFIKEDREKCGVCLGSTLGGMISAGKYYRHLKKTKNPLVSLLLDYPLYSAGSHIAERYNLKGPNIVISTACSSSNIALGYALDLIRYGEQDIMLAGGFDTMAELTWAGFGVLRNVSSHFCRPFDKNREGLVLGEGAGILVLEELERCKSRGRKILGEILGYGLSSDAYHMTAPDVTGKGPSMAMIKALEDSELKPENIDYINAHGTGTFYNDLIETRTIKKVFGSHAYKTPISSTKSMTGHTLGASGAIETIVSLIAINNNFIPPTINYQTPDPNCDLDYVPNESREKLINCVISNNFGFGGNNCSVVAGRYREGGSI